MTIEERLREALSTRAEAVRVEDDAWATITAGLQEKRRIRPLFAAAAVAAALILVVIGLAIAGRGGRTVQTVGPTGASSPHERLVLLRAGTHPNAEIVDANTGARRTVPLPGLFAGSLSPDSVFLIGDAIVVQYANTVYALPATLDGPPRILGFAARIFPSTTQGKVWLASVGGGVREIDTSGTDTSSERVPPPGFTPIGAVEGGLVGTKQLQPPPATTWIGVWDPTTGSVRGIIGAPAVVAAAGRTVATVGGAAYPGVGIPLELVDILTGDVRTVLSPRGSFLSGPGVMSPDGSALITFAGTGSANELVAVDVASGRATVVPDGPTRPVTLPYIGWSPDSQWFFFATPDSHNRRQLLAYSRGSKALAKVHASLGPFDAAVVLRG